MTLSLPILKTKSKLTYEITQKKIQAVSDWKTIVFVVYSNSTSYHGLVRMTFLSIELV